MVIRIKNSPNCKGYVLVICGVVNVNQLQMVYECSYAPAFISNVLQIPYGGYLNTTFNNAPVQIVNYVSEGFWQIGIGLSLIHI